MPGTTHVDPPSIVAIDTPEGEARAHLCVPAGPACGALVLGHGAGGGVAVVDLQTARDVAMDHGFAVALVEQPYRVAGRRAPPRAPRLDAAWSATCAALASRGPLAGLAQITGGRSSGARVACRTAAATGARAVLCLAFPLVPPARRGGDPGASRLPELDAVPVPVLVAQGARDRFGMPPGSARRTVVVVAGDHALRGDRAAVAAAIGSWLDAL